MKRTTFVRALVVGGILLVNGGAPGAQPQHPDFSGQWQSHIILPLSDKKALKKENYKLTGVVGGVRFDIDGDGIEEQIAWTHQSSHLAFLALDRNGNGKIDSGKELFGNHTFAGVGNGFYALLREATGTTAIISEGHPLYEKLLLWEDENHNGISEAWELHKFSDHYVGIGTGYRDSALTDKYGNEFRYEGWAAVRDPGKFKKFPEGEPGAEKDILIPIWDVFLRLP